MPENKPRVHFSHPLLRARDYQFRAEFDDLCEWYRAGARGVCALVGIGGAGKTAIADRFLRVLPGVMEDDPGLPKDSSLPAPESVFVFSFYDEPNPDTFFDNLYEWLIGEFNLLDRRTKTEAGNVIRASEPLVADALHRLSGRMLLVLDGLEKVQDDGAPGGVFGRIDHGALRAFVGAVAEGRLPGVGLIITTRFRLIELEAFARLFRCVFITTMSVEAAVALLRSRGVRRGTDSDLHRLVKEQGLHALTVDLLGGYIAEFCDGDPAKMPADPEERRGLIERTEALFNPGLFALKEQERKFNRLAERYREGFKERDPAALALLERVCLFRLGADVKVLESVFLGEDKVSVSGPHLAALTPKELHAKLTKLKEMRLLEEVSAFRIPNSEFYSVHPAIRDGFLSGLDRDTSTATHEALRKGIYAQLPKDLKRTDGEMRMASLMGLPGGNPSDPGILDMLEEIVYHTLEAGHTQEAWDVYWNRIGGFENLGWRLGDYQRGERICRAFAGGRPPESAPFPDGMSEINQAIWINEWGLYLIYLGRPGAAAHCYERGNEPDMQSGNWKGASIGRQNLSESLLLSGRLAPGFQAAQEALDLAERADDDSERLDSYAYRAYARGLRGEIDASLEDSRSALDCQHKAGGNLEQPLSSLRGIWHTLLLTRLGRLNEAGKLTRENRTIMETEWGQQNDDIPRCDLVLSDLSRRHGNIAEARSLLDQARNWAIGRDAKVILCWADLVSGKIDISDPESDAESAIRSFNNGLGIARECGYGIYHIDLLVWRAKGHLLLGDANGALHDARAALYGLERVSENKGPYAAPALDEDSKPEDRGIFPPNETGRPELLAATHPECGYAWGEGDARHALAEALLLQAAQIHRNTGFVPGKRNQLPKKVQNLITRAEKELKECLKLRKRIQDPNQKETLEVMKELKEGILTKYPLETTVLPKEPPESVKEATPAVEEPFDVFLSHNSKEKPIVIKIAEALQKRGLRVWLDTWSLTAGKPWQDEIEKVLPTVKSLAVLVGPRDMGPWTRPEVRLGIDQSVKRNIPVIPVLLPGAPADLKLPLLLQQYTWVDLRDGLTDEGLDKLYKGIKGE